MSSTAIDAVTADRAALLTICDGFSDADWNAPSGCEGWSVKDLVTHLDALWWTVVDPSQLPDATGVPTDAAQERFVSARRSMSADELVADYAAVSEKAIDVLTTLVGQEFELELGDLGTYPASAIPAAFAFDHYTHIRADLFAPRGSLAGPPPVSDALRLAPAMEWIEVALPQQNRQALAGLSGGQVEIVVTGPAPAVLRAGPEGPVLASVQSDGDACVRWITQRATWESVGASAGGDADALAVLRSLKIF
jgi:uncharacterized protein (TIGR03083 family)